MYDVIVCGAGPAGSVAATVLARGGARVLLLDRARFPRPKLCGDTINPGTVAMLRRLAMTADIEGVALPVHGMLVTGEHGVRVSAPYAAGVHGLAIERRVLDEALVRAAAAAGVRVEDGVLVRAPLLDTTGREPRVRGIVMAGRDGRDVRVPAPMVIAADGRRSRLAVGAGLARQPRRPRRWAIGAYFRDVTGMTSFGEMHVRRGRYVGIAPLPSGDTNVCVVMPGPSGRGRAAFEDPAALLRLAVDRDGTLRERFAGARMTTAPQMMGPLAMDATHCGMPGLLLAGDAAGFIDPMTGDGVRFAVRGGELAAEVALAALAGGANQPHASLARLRRAEFSGKWRFNRTLRRLVGAPVAVELAGVTAAAAPWILRRTIAFAGDVPHR